MSANLIWRGLQQNREAKARAAQLLSLKQEAEEELERLDCGPVDISPQTIARLLLDLNDRLHRLELALEISGVAPKEDVVPS